jgi:hypothetical protein
LGKEKGVGKGKGVKNGVSKGKGVKNVCESSKGVSSSASQEGLGGGQRAHSSGIGTVRPETVWARA